MAAHPNVEKVGALYRALGQGDLTTVLGNLVPDAVIHINGSGPLSGDHRGGDAISAVLTDLVAFTAGTLTLDVTSVFADDHHGVVLLHESATRLDGATLAIDEVHLLSLDDRGRITELWDLPRDPEVHERFFDNR